MRYMATIFIELRDLDVTRIAEADREVESVMHREGFSKHGSEFSGPTNREADDLAQHLNTAVLPHLTTVGKPFATVTHHRKA